MSFCVGPETLIAATEAAQARLGDAVTYRDISAVLQAAAPFIVAETAQRIADDLQSWAGPAERGYTQSFAETAAQQLPT